MKDVREDILDESKIIFLLGEFVTCTVIFSQTITILTLFHFICQDLELSCGHIQPFTALMRVILILSAT